MELDDVEARAFLALLAGRIPAVDGMLRGAGLPTGTAPGSMAALGVQAGLRLATLDPNADDLVALATANLERDREELHPLLCPPCRWPPHLCDGPEWLDFLLGLVACLARVVDDEARLLASILDNVIRAALTIIRTSDPHGVLA